MNQMRPRVFVLPGALKAIRQLHLPSAMSQAELAEKSGVSGGLIGQIESGIRQPSPHIAAAMAESLGVTVDAFCIELHDLSPRSVATRLRAVIETAAA